MHAQHCHGAVLPCVCTCCALGYLIGVSVLFRFVAGKRSELEALLDAMAADGIEHTAATSRTLAALERQLRS